jgi:hypothetical protein
MGQGGWGSALRQKQKIMGIFHYIFFTPYTVFVRSVLPCSGRIASLRRRSKSLKSENSDSTLSKIKLKLTVSACLWSTWDCITSEMLQKN